MPDKQRVSYCQAKRVQILNEEKRNGFTNKMTFTESKKGSRIAIKERNVSLSDTIDPAGLVGLLCAGRLPINRFVAVHDVQEAVFVVVLLIYLAHGVGRGWYRAVDEEEQRFLGAQINALSDDENKLAHCELRWHQIFFLVNIRNASFWAAFHNYRYSFWISQTDLVAVSSPSFKRVFLLVFKLHDVEVLML